MQVLSGKSMAVAFKKKWVFFLILRGLLQLENITYGIEPLESSATFEHILYEIKNNKIDYSPLKENFANSEQESQSYRILVKPEIGRAHV